MKASTLRTLVLLTALLIGVGFALVFFYAPNEADQGFIQKIFYLHVPLAIVALGGFVLGGIHAIRHLRSGDPVHDARSYVSIHASVIFGVAVLVTGAIWAKASWGKWWVWDEPTLVSFLIVFLLYCTYYPLRYAIEDRERQARYASVFAITAGAFVPLNFMAVRAGRVARPPAHVRHRRGRPAGRHVADVPRLLRRHRAPLGDARQLRADREADLRRSSRGCAAPSTTAPSAQPRAAASPARIAPSGAGSR